ncbi:MAG: hypothetical protein ACE5IR_15130 [bacterium]
MPRKGKLPPRDAKKVDWYCRRWGMVASLGGFLGRKGDGDPGTNSTVQEKNQALYGIEWLIRE